MTRELELTLNGVQAGCGLNVGDDDLDDDFSGFILNDDEPIDLPMYDFGDRPATSPGEPTDFNGQSDFDWGAAFREKSAFGTAHGPAGESLDPRECC